MRVWAALASGWVATAAWAGEVHEAPLDEPPPPAGMHKLTQAEAQARSRTGESGPKGAVAVFCVARSEATRQEAASLEAGLEDALHARGVELVDLDVLFPPAPPAALSRGEDLFKEGRNAYDNLDVERAADKFTQAMTFYAKHPVETRPADLGRVLVFLGAALELNSDSAGAKDAFQRALLIDPAAKPDSDLFGRDVQRAFGAAKAELAERAKGMLHVESSPPRARVWVRGEPKGLTPVPDLSLTAGRHQLLIRRAGYLPFGAFPDVKAGQTTEVEAVLEPTGGLASMQAAAAKLVAPALFGASGIPREAKAVGERLGARYLVMVAQDTARTELQTWDLLTGNKLTGVTLKSMDDAGAAEGAAQVQDWIDHPPANGLAQHVPKVMKQWWFWAAVAGTAAVVSGVAVASSGHPHSLFPGDVP